MRTLFTQEAILHRHYINKINWIESIYVFFLFAFVCCLLLYVYMCDFVCFSLGVNKCVFACQSSVCAYMCVWRKDMVKSYCAAQTYPFRSSAAGAATRSRFQEPACWATSSSPTNPHIKEANGGLCRPAPGRLRQESRSFLLYSQPIANLLQPLKYIHLACLFLLLSLTDCWVFLSDTRFVPFLMSGWCGSHVWVVWFSLLGGVVLMTGWCGAHVWVVWFSCLGGVVLMSGWCGSHFWVVW